MTSLLTPVLESGAVDLSDGQTFRKRVLPLGEIHYPNGDGTARRVTFDGRYIDGVISAFREKANDVPTLQLADADNSHNEDPERAVGTVVDLSRERPGDSDGPGLYATIRADDRGAAILRRFPTLGASARLKEGHQRITDGRTFPAVLRHVLLCAHGRVPQMGPWRTVSLSDEDGQVIDLSTGRYEETDDMGAGGDASDDVGRVLELSDEEIEAALAAAADLDDGSGDDTDDEQDEPDMSLSDTRTRRPSPRPREDATMVDLAAALEERDKTVRGVQAQLARSQWNLDRTELAAAGVPKADLDLAEEVLAYPGDGVIDLADDTGESFAVNAKQVIRKLLEGRRGTIDLSTPDGSSDEPPASAAVDGDAEAFAEQWGQQSGI